jgi:hypothetical protein
MEFPLDELGRSRMHKAQLGVVGWMDWVDETTWADLG